MGDCFGKPFSARVKFYTFATYRKGNRCHIIHFDIIGLTYWMLARIEEIGRTDLDAHQRLLSTSSHAFKKGYLERPIVDEWLHILGQVIQRQWPSLELKKHLFDMKVSHDVDNPSCCGFLNFNQLIKIWDIMLLRSEILIQHCEHHG